MIVTGCTVRSGDHTINDHLMIATGCTVRSWDTNDQLHIDKFHAATEVEFDDLTPEVINAYIKTGEPMLV